MLEIRTFMPSLNKQLVIRPGNWEVATEISKK